MSHICLKNRQTTNSIYQNHTTNAALTVEPFDSIAILTSNGIPYRLARVIVMSGAAG